MAYPVSFTSITTVKMKTQHVILIFCGVALIGVALTPWLVAWRDKLSLVDEFARTQLELKAAEAELSRLLAEQTKQAKFRPRHARLRELLGLKKLSDKNWDRWQAFNDMAIRERQDEVDRKRERLKQILAILAR